MKYNPSGNNFVFDEHQMNTPYFRVYESARQAKLADGSHVTYSPKAPQRQMQDFLLEQNFAEQEQIIEQPKPTYVVPKAKRFIPVLIVLILFVAVLAVSALGFAGVDFLALYQINTYEPNGDSVTAYVSTESVITGFVNGFSGIEGLAERLASNLYGFESQEDFEKWINIFWVAYFATGQFEELEQDTLDAIIKQHQDTLTAEDFAVFTKDLGYVQALAMSIDDFEASAFVAYGLPVSIALAALTALAGLIVAIIALTGKKRLSLAFKIISLLLLAFVVVIIICGLMFASAFADVYGIEDASFFATGSEGISVAIGAFVLAGVAVLSAVMSFFTYKSKKKSKPYYLYQDGTKLEA
jgi:cytochrome c oxidase subunit IV